MKDDDKWTVYDQAKLEQLTSKRAKFYTENTQPILKLITVLHGREYKNNQECAEHFIARAAEWRDALEPFDNGARVRVRSE